MRLSDLGNNEQGIITRVSGSGAFRKRITEMGFIKGKLIKVVKNAPLNDPVQYSILGYEVSLRRKEAEMIEITTSLEEQEKEIKSNTGGGSYVIRTKGVDKQFTVALVGNPNSGKTTVFNFASKSKERVGNYSGVTIESKEAVLEYKGYKLALVDLPGTYSLTAYSPEELYVRQYLRNKRPDIIINVVDASNLERNLYLTTQLIDMNMKVIIALNMFDELKRSGDKFDFIKLGEMMGVPFVPTVGSKGVGVGKLFEKVIEIAQQKELTVRNLNYGIELEAAIENIKNTIEQNLIKPTIISPRYLSIKLLEKDKEAYDHTFNFLNGQDIRNVVKYEIQKLENRYKEDCETLVTDNRYGFISGALKETYSKSKIKTGNFTGKIDNFLTHKILGLPLFLLFMFIMFQFTFKAGSFPMHWIDHGVALLGTFINNNMPAGILKDLIIEGIIGGVGGVIVFLPNILILFFFISIMEDTGYMARAAFLMDKIMHMIGLHGRSFIPLLMGFGCNVPAIMSTRTIENRSNRILTILINPFMSCSARLPVYILFISAFFPKNSGLVLFSIYISGIIIAGIFAIIFKKVFFKTNEAPFVMELPPYRIPTVKAITRHMWMKAVQYLKKMGGVILTASVIIWALETFPKNVQLSRDYKQEIANIEDKYNNNGNNSNLNKSGLNNLKQIEIANVLLEQNAEMKEKAYIGRLGHWIEPVMRPLGFDWKMSIGLLTGIAAKEIVVSTLGVLHHVDVGSNSVSLSERLRDEKIKSGPNKGKPLYNPLTALCYMIFILIYFPCIAVIASVKKETGSWKWAAFTVFYTTGLAWVIAFMVNKAGGLII